MVIIVRMAGSLHRSATRPGDLNIAEACTALLCSSQNELVLKASVDTMSGNWWFCSPVLAADKLTGSGAPV